METLVRTIGKVKLKRFENEFDFVVDEFKLKAIRLGYIGELKFKKEKGYMIIFVEVKKQRNMVKENRVIIKGKLDSSRELFRKENVKLRLSLKSIKRLIKQLQKQL